MNQSQRNHQIRAMLDLIKEQRSMLGESGHLTISHYTSSDYLEKELESLFQGLPIILAHSDQLANPGDFISLTIGNRPLILNRDREGKLHCFINACRHRGAKLVDEPCGTAKAFKCPYHAWAYMDNGKLQHVPNKEAFPELEMQNLALAELAIEEMAGFIWLKNDSLASDSLATFLEPVTSELLDFELPAHRLVKSDIQAADCNWKLVIDAFSEGYHLKTLHKDSVKPFFLEHGITFEKLGLHSRSVGARKEILQAEELPESEWDFRAWTTPFYTLFPNTVLVFHPDWISRISVFPNGVDRCVVHHDMLVHESLNKSHAYWEKTFSLINEQVFAAEDIAVCQQVQSTAISGADDTWIVGGLETPVLWFHQNCAKFIN